MKLGILSSPENNTINNPGNLSPRREPPITLWKPWPSPKTKRIGFAHASPPFRSSRRTQSRRTKVRFQRLIVRAVTGRGNEIQFRAAASHCSCIVAARARACARERRRRYRTPWESNLSDTGLLSVEKEKTNMNGGRWWAKTGVEGSSIHQSQRARHLSTPVFFLLNPSPRSTSLRETPR